MRADHVTPWSKNGRTVPKIDKMLFTDYTIGKVIYSPYKNEGSKCGADMSDKDKKNFPQENLQAAIKTDKDYPSARLLLDMNKIEYEREFERANALDTKVNIALTLSAALLVIVYPLTNIRALFRSYGQAAYSYILPALCIISTSAAFGFLIAAIFVLMNVISLHSYSVIQPRDFNKPEYISKAKNIMTFALATMYLFATEENRVVNESRFQKYQKAINLVVVAIVFLVVSYVVKYNFL